MPGERTHLLNLRVSEEELAKLKSLAAANDETMAQVVRRWVRTFYAQAFGEMAPSHTVATRSKSKGS
jgi:hypothetical protein